MPGLSIGQIGLGLGRRSAGSSAPSYSPSVLFAASEAGFWAPVATSRMWQDTGRTSPVTTVGQSVASWELTTASGVVYATQSTAGQQPTYQLDGSLPYLSFDGTDDWLSVALDLSAIDEVTVIAGVQKNTDATTGIVVEHTANANANIGSFFMVTAANSTTQRYAVFGRGNAAPTAAQQSNATSGTAIEKAVLAGLYSIDPPSNQIRRNKTAFTAAVTSQGTGNYANSTLYIGRRGGTTLPLDGRIYGLIVRGAPTTGASLTDAEDWMNGLTAAY